MNPHLLPGNIFSANLSLFVKTVPWDIFSEFNTVFENSFSKYPWWCWGVSTLFCCKWVSLVWGGQRHLKVWKWDPESDEAHSPAVLCGLLMAGRKGNICINILSGDLQNTILRSPKKGRRWSTNHIHAQSEGSLCKKGVYGHTRASGWIFEM